MIDLIRPNFANYQLEFLYCQERFSVVEACTKSGKTFSHLFWLFEIAQGGNKQWYYNAVEPGWEFWWVAPVYAQSEIAFNRLKMKVQGIDGYSLNASKLTIQTPYGTIIRFKTAKDPNNLYGEDVRAAVFDEFTRAKAAAWHALRSTLTATNAPCKLIGNYTGSLNWGHKLGEKAKTNANYSYHKIDAFDAIDAGILKKEEVEAARNDLPKPIFNSLYLVKGSSEGDILYNADSLTAMFSNSFIKPSRQKYITADIALHGSDRFVIGIWGGWVLKKIISVDKCDALEVEQMLRDLAKKWRVPLTNITYDADGLGTFLRGYLKQAKPFNNGGSPIFSKSKKVKPNYANLKTQCAYEIAQKVNDHEIYIEDNYYEEDIKSELEVIRKDNIETDGKLKITPKKEIKKLLGFSPDFAEMFIMRYYFELKSAKGGIQMIDDRPNRN